MTLGEFVIPNKVRDLAKLNHYPGMMILDTKTFAT
jgi:hypothetical protein